MNVTDFMSQDELVLYILFMLTIIIYSIVRCIQFIIVAINEQEAWNSFFYGLGWGVVCFISIKMFIILVDISNLMYN